MVKAIKLVFDKNDTYKELESFLSSHNISVGWGTKDINKEAIFKEKALSSIMRVKYHSDFTDKEYDKYGEEAEKLIKKYKERMTIDEIVKIKDYELEGITSQKSNMTGQYIWDMLEYTNS